MKARRDRPEHPRRRPGRPPRRYAPPLSPSPGRRGRAAWWRLLAASLVVGRSEHTGRRPGLKSFRLRDARDIS
eukprot:scaffold40790_cov72-Phaeocystis_antarctica.AAC.3